MSAPDQDIIEEKIKPRARVYIDGFNLYFSVIKHTTGAKWLNLESFFDSLRIDDQIERINYFTAIVEPERPQSAKRERQATFLKALGTLDRVKIIKGRYQSRTVKCGANCRQTYNVPEEKKTDVNIALTMVDDALNDRVDRIILVSGDSDLEPAVEYICRQRPKVKVFVYVPQNPNSPHRRNNRHYSSIGATVKQLPLTTISNHALPDPIVLADGSSITKPATW